MRFSWESVFWALVALAVGGGLYLYTAKHPAKPPARFYQKDAPAKQAAVAPENEATWLQRRMAEAGLAPRGAPRALGCSGASVAPVVEDSVESVLAEYFGPAHEGNIPYTNEAGEAGGRVMVATCGRPGWWASLYAGALPLQTPVSETIEEIRAGLTPGDSPIIYYLDGDRVMAKLNRLEGPFVMEDDFPFAARVRAAGPGLMHIWLSGGADEGDAAGMRAFFARAAAIKQDVAQGDPPWGRN